VFVVISLVIYCRCVSESLYDLFGVLCCCLRCYMYNEGCWGSKWLEVDVWWSGIVMGK